MNQSSSSSSKSNKTQNIKKGPKFEQRTKKQQQRQYSRSPLQDLNTTIACNSTITSCSSSIEAPRGCLRFFLSHSTSSSNTKTPLINRPTKIKPLSKTPKSAPNPSKRSRFQKPISQEGDRVKRNTPCLYQWQSGKKPSSKNASKGKNLNDLNVSGSSVNKIPSGSQLRFCDVKDADFTPLHKIATGSGLKFTLDKKDPVIVEDDDDEKLSNTSGNNKTPPIQASVSPEIQTHCGSSFKATSTTPACYAAGHILSGVDKRKCRPRGILTVGDNCLLDFDTAKVIDSFDEGDGNKEGNVIRVLDNSSGVSMLPLPAEASMHWLLSPCSEKSEDQKEKSENGSCQFRLHSPCSSLFSDEFASDLCNDSNNRKSVTSSSGRRRRSPCLLSPVEVPQFQGIPGLFHDNVTSSPPKCTPSCEAAAALQAERNFCYDGENSPFSTDTLGSGNVIKTPQSDSSSDRCVGLSWLKAEAGKKHFDSELDLIAESLEMTSLSSRGYESIWDPTSSSFQFDCLPTPSDSVDLSCFQKILHDRASWMSTSTSENVSQSQMRVSWREGLVSRIFEMDEFDSCRYLSDEDADVNSCYNDQLKSCPKTEPNVDIVNYDSLKNDILSTESEQKSEEKLPCQVSCSCAESISTDGGGLAASGDSDWTQCYKNQLFQV